MIKKFTSTALLVLSCVLLMAPSLAEEKIRPFMPDSLNQIKANYAGKPFIIVIWSLDCVYCQASFNTLAEIKRKHGISVVTIATDSAADETSRNMIEGKLVAAGLASEIWAFGQAPAEQLRYAIDPKWRGEMPRTYWFNSRGQAAAYSGQVTKDIADKFSLAQVR